MFVLNHLLIKFKTNFEPITFEDIEGKFKKAEFILRSVWTVFCANINKKSINAHDA